MVLFDSSATYLEQSSLLITARPTTTRITTHYSLPRQTTRKTQRSKPSSTEDTDKAAPAQAAAPISAVLTLKTYDPVSGVVLKYKTNRAAEVGRLMAALGRLGGVMARGRDVELENQNQGTEMDVDTPAEGVSAPAVPAALEARSGTSTPAGTGTATPAGNSGATSGKGKGKKKKGGK